MIEFKGEVIKSARDQALIGLYGAATLFAVLFPLQLFSQKIWNLIHIEAEEITMATPEWFHYLAAFVILVAILSLPYMLGRFDNAYNRTYLTVIIFYIISIPASISAYMSSLPDTLSWYSLDAVDYYAVALAVVVICGGLMSIIGGLYANPPISTSVSKSANISDPRIRQTRLQVIIQDQDKYRSVLPSLYLILL